jgi:hypothetical protein
MFSPIPTDPGASLLGEVDPTTTGWDSVNVAVDPTDGALYIGDRGIFGIGLGKLISDGAPTPTYTADPSFAPPGFSDLASMAVDPSTGDVIAVDPGVGLIYRLSSTGEVLSTFDGSGTLQGPGAVSVAPDGTIYIVDTADGNVQRFTSAGVPDGTVALPDGANAEVLAVHPTSGDLAVVVRSGESRSIEGYDSAGQHLFSAALPASVTGVHGVAWGDDNNRLYVSRGRGEVLTLERVLQAGLDAPVIVSSSRNTARVAATVATGGQLTDVRLEYCPASQACSQYGSSDPLDPHNPWVRGPVHSELQGSGEETIEDDLPLTSNVEWQIRAVAINERIASTSDVTNYSSPLVAPGVETGAASSVGETEALLNGTIDAIGAQTTYHFDYGLTDAYGSSVPTGTEASAGGGHLLHPVSRTITGLAPGTTYHYRLVASNAAGTTEGADRTFTTAGPGAFPQRAYEQVTPVDKKGAQVRSDFHFQAKADGSAFAPVVAAAAADADSSNLLANYVTYRGADAWSDWQPTDPPLNVATGIFEATTAGISDDFEHALVISNRALAPGGIENGGNLYVRDLRDNTYTFVAGSADADAFRGFAGASQNTTILIKAAPDYSWIVFNWTRLITDPVGTAVYRWSRTEGLELVSVMPDGSPAPYRTEQNGFGTQPWASEDGKVVYFGLENGQGGPVYRREGDQTTLVSHGDGNFIPPSIPIPARIAWVSPDGRYAFINATVPAPLTADTPPGVNGIYRYDAETDQLTYITSFTGGTFPVGAVSDDGLTVYMNTTHADGALQVWHDGVLQTVAAQPGKQMSTSPSGRYFAWSDPSGEAHFYDRDTGESACISCPADGSSGAAHMRADTSTMSNRVPTVVTDDGTVFFDTAARLLTADHNGSLDVYAYKGGRVALISPGDEDSDARFLDASVDGRDVFFATEEGLVGQDIDGDWDVYDARIGGGFASQSPPPGATPCVRSECGEPVNPSSDGPVIATGGEASDDREAARPAISRLKPLSASDRARLAKGGKAHLKLSLTRPGTLAVIGTATIGGKKRQVISTTVRARKAGPVSVPLSVTKQALSELKRKGALRVRLAVSISGASKVTSFTLKFSGDKKGGRS